MLVSILWRFHWIASVCRAISTAPNNLGEVMHSPTPITPAPLSRDARAPSLMLDELHAGDVVEVTTKSGSRWTFVPTRLSTSLHDRINKVVVTTTSKRAGQILRPWQSMTVQCQVEIGRSIYFSGWYTRTGELMHTGEVTGVYLNGTKVL